MSNFDGPDKSHYSGIDDRYFQSVNREPIKMFDVVPAGPAVPVTGTVRFIVPLGSTRIVTKVSVIYTPNDPSIDPFPNLRLVTDARLWMALRDKNRAGNKGHVVGVRNVLGSRLAPAPIPAPGLAAADADGLCGHANSFGGPGVIFPIPFLGDFQFVFSPTGIFDECIGELSITALAATCPPGQWVLQTRWEAAVQMSPEEWSFIKSLLDPRVGHNAAVSGGQPPPT